MAQTNQATPQHDTSEYPAPIRQAGPRAMVVYDRVEKGLLADGYTADEASMLMDINLAQILAEAKATKKTPRK